MAAAALADTCDVSELLQGDRLVIVALYIGDDLMDPLRLLVVNVERDKVPAQQIERFPQEQHLDVNIDVPADVLRSIEIEDPPQGVQDWMGNTLLL